MEKVVKPLLTGLFLMVLGVNLGAQVTIGSDTPPSKAALLELKTQPDSNPAQGGVTSDKGGLLLPRVILEENNSLKPFIAGGGSPEEKAAHKGLMVYHIGGNGINAGQHVWDGSKWLVLLTDIPPTPMKTADVLYTNKSQFIQIYDDETGGNMSDYDEVDFSTDRRPNAPKTEIVIEEEGFYAVALRTFIRFANYTDDNPNHQISIPLKGSYWIHYALCGQISGRSKTIKDNYVGVYNLDAKRIGNATETPFNSLSYNAIAQSITFTGYFQAGEKLSIVLITDKAHKVTHNSKEYAPVLFKRAASDMDPDDTALIYWKL